MNMHAVAWWPTVFALAIATFTDLRSRRIPNWLVFPFMGAGIGVQAWLHGWHGVAQSLEGFALGAVLFGVLAAMGGMGMGDVKLFAGIGAWIGPGQLMLALVITGVAGGLMALGWALDGRICRRAAEGFGGPDAGLAETRNDRSSGIEVDQSVGAQDALCAGDRHRDLDFVLRALGGLAGQLLHEGDGPLKPVQDRCRITQGTTNSKPHASVPKGPPPIFCPLS